MTHYRYEVGKPYNPQVARWPEIPHLRITADGPELAIFFENPSEREIRAIRRGTPSFAWVDDTHTGVLAFAFADGVPWSDCSYSPHLDKDYAIPAGWSDDDAAVRPVVHVILVDALTGRIKAMRQITWPHDFAATVLRTVRRLAQHPFDKAAHAAAVNALMSRYPNTAQLVSQRADAKAEGTAA